MIIIKKITISNYRSYKNEQNQINDLKRLNMFTGKNNTGKTNILRAINLFFNPDSYDPKLDMNMIKQLTGGAAQHPTIKVYIEDDEIEKEVTKKYTIKLNLNEKESKKRYSVSGRDIPQRLSNSREIEKYLNLKFKCIYLSTTDEDISEQAYTIVNDMILQYYKKKNRAIKDTVDEFEERYKRLLETFKDNIDDLEGDLSKQFGLLKKNAIEISPKLKIENNTSISDFLLDNIRLELDDSYSQIIKAKGAGIQRTSLILLSFFLLNEIYKNTNKVILLDEPEAFLYPLLISGLKETIENSITESNKSQMFLTSHSREFLTEINNSEYSFYNIDQVSETKQYQRSKNDYDINKFSVISQFDPKTKFEVLKNYGLLDKIDDHETVIICEGRTDRNYIAEILSDKDFRPQIRFEKTSDYVEDGQQRFNKDLDHNFIPSGAQAILPILIYLDRISSIHRKVFVLLDGDDEGQKVYKHIKQSEFKNLSIKKYKLDKNKEIEDMVYLKKDFVERVILLSPAIHTKQKEYKEIMSSCSESDSVVAKTEEFIKLYNLNQNIYNLKNMLSNNLDKSLIQKEWLLSELEGFFY